MLRRAARSVTKQLRQRWAAPGPRVLLAHRYGAKRHTAKDP
ncbi:hypothetical protein AVU99_gp055 [Mycobacterium phage Lolly9]|uniref:Uncharacterized protein n=1 Tax=Mycobacterium phage Lolly9 TaxID=1698711 RepID=A0A0K2FMU9_9CAUD|nr:hypothetical protein AVU99_gp055 [Mycobacterium phage Lolly9]ALA48542.1 hypothetical protein LOLLY9_135 [Mycobacterium phage Lolly9]